ncbi:MAG: hypothetical protein COT34_01705 [Candidatus Nealsonbacteria bacterium CG08_land_8_20_14_0_20_43_11]|uniref:ATPase n=1 Tax=Candidatus Nealsonbacteria bacterium CG08_land_8_20_14_0_20_43_11 TaxID=1974706 RepID=A0A2M6T0H2_9BACT|nr:MAG: hypothetical protein COT34_01705 [Candidatus Nealsonbacteria bacterium CG08_land_8_20_14_0_20_43_11]
MLIERQIYKKIKPFLSSKETIVVTGMRRVGKTTLLKFIFQQIKSENKLMIDLENPLNRKIFEESDYERIKISLEGLDLDFKKRAYLFLDEIQFAPNIPSVVKYLLDHYKVKFFLTGSASFYLKNLFSESLAGRKFLFEIFPFNFQEFLVLKGNDLVVPKKSTQFLWQKFSSFYEEYLEFGGFPEVILKTSKQEKIKALQEVFSSYFQMEVKQLGDFKKDEKIRDMLLLLAERVGNKLDVQKLSQELGLARETVYQYLAFLEGTYFIHTIKPFSQSRDIEIRKTPKLYLCDCGLANQIAKLNRGSLFEQAVFQGLKPKGEINYYQRKSGAEIDFILNKKTAYEVKTTPQQSDLNGLTRVSDEIGVKDYKLISLNYSKLNKVIYGFEI